MVETSVIIVQFFNGLSQAMLLVMIAAGLSIIFGLMDVLNFAHGSFYMLGAYVGLTTYTVTNQFWLAIIISFILIGVIGGILEYATLRPLYDRDPVYHLLITFGFLLVMDHAAQIIWSAKQRSMTTPEYMDFSVQLLNITYPMYRIFVFGIGVVFTVGLYLLIQRSDIGLIVRAGTHNKETVRAMGIDLPRIFTLTFAFGTGIAAISGVIAAPIVGLSPSMGTAIIIDAFIVVVIGGLGSFRGAVVAALIIAEIRALGVLITPRFTVVFVFLALIIMLTVRPAGLFGDLAAQGGEH